MGSEIQYQPPRHVVPLPLCAPQTGGDNHGVGDTVSTPSSRCATPPMCSANRGRQSCQPAVWVRDTVSTPSSRCATPPICSANRGRQSCQPVVWVRDTASTPSSLRATPPMCFANRGRQSFQRWRGQRYGINPLVTLCHSPYVLRKQGETILPASGVGVAPWGLGWRNPRLQPWGWWRPPYRSHRGRAVTRLETFTDGGDK